MAGGRKRRRTETANQEASPGTNTNNNNSSNGKKQKMTSGKNNKKKHDDNNHKMDNMEDWITNLAKQAALSSASSNGNGASIKNVEARKENRAAKQQRRQERLQQKASKKEQQQQTAASVTKSGDTITILTTTSSNTAGHTTGSSKKRLKTLATTCKQILKEQHKNSIKVGKHGPYREAPTPFRPGISSSTSSSSSSSKRRKFKQWNEETIQPRPRDYGGLGLALPSLWLAFADPSFTGRLEEEFQQHIDGFFGKQRTKAMKKQLDGNMLWRQFEQARLKKQKKNGAGTASTTYGSKNKKTKATAGNMINMNQKIDGKRLSDMTPDQRVEAMLKAGLL